MHISCTECNFGTFLRRKLHFFHGSHRRNVSGCKGSGDFGDFLKYFLNELKNYNIFNERISRLIRKKMRIFSKVFGQKFASLLIMFPKRLFHFSYPCFTRFRGALAWLPVFLSVNLLLPLQKRRHCGAICFSLFHFPSLLSGFLHRSDNRSAAGDIGRRVPYPQERVCRRNPRLTVR